MTKKKLTHLDANGRARMVDVGAKDVTLREATALAVVTMKDSTKELLFSGKIKKGDALTVAEIAGIQAAKRTPELIPLCHGIALTKVAVTITRGKTKGEVRIAATAHANDRTGVEMEAMTAASVSALALYDMVKSVDRSVSFTVRLEAKSGGKSGAWKR